MTELRLSSTQISDEDLYTCEGTFIAPEDNCESVTTIQLNILGKSIKLIKINYKFNILKAIEFFLNVLLIYINILHQLIN